ncbi:MAG: hypothetical protein IJS35_01015 [Firmicutes bacterium]|nr:hypothetical protein [Bacillota bacterium]
MKKILAVIVASLTVFSLSACGFGSRTDTSSVETGISQPVVEDDRTLEEIAGPKTRKFLHDYSEEDGYTMTCTVNASGSELNLLSVIKGDKSYVNIDREEGGYSVLVNGEDVYMIMHSSKLAYKMDPDSVKYGSYIQEANSMLYGSTYSEGTITIDGVTYDSENYEGPYGNVKYCFLNDVFSYIVVDAESEYVAIKITSLSNDVDESLFEVPEDYKIR